MADNAGYDSAQLVSELRAIHTDGKQTWGISKLLLFLEYLLFLPHPLSPPSLEVRAYFLYHYHILFQVRFLSGWGALSISYFHQLITAAQLESDVE